MLKAPPANAHFRPTTDRVKESLFNVLTHSVGFAGRRVLDLFAGTGSLGIEALSRGAESAVFVESARKHAKIIEENIAALKVQDRAKVIVSPVESFLKKAPGAFDLILCDPPYAYDGIQELLETMAEAGMLVEEGICCVEHGGKETIAAPAGWQLLQIKQYGTTSITLMEPTDK